LIRDFIVTRHDEFLRESEVERGWKVGSKEIQMGAAGRPTNIFLNDGALYDEIGTCHKLFFDIFFEFSMRTNETFKISLRSTVKMCSQ
jgi:hypothetical protein